MSPVRCAYCGTLSENPVQLRWILRGEAARASVLANLPLCTRCRNSWCVPTPTELHSDVPADGHDTGHERRVA
jgi:hypothetical protein